MPRKKKDANSTTTPYNEMEAYSFIETRRKTGLSFKQIAEEANEKGLLTPRGKPWNDQNAHLFYYKMKNKLHNASRNTCEAWSTEVSQEITEGARLAAIRSITESTMDPSLKLQAISGLTAV